MMADKEKHVRQTKAEEDYSWQLSYANTFAGAETDGISQRINESREGAKYLVQANPGTEESNRKVTRIAQTMGRVLQILIPDVARSVGR